MSDFKNLLDVLLLRLAADSIENQREGEDNDD